MKRCKRKNNCFTDCMVLTSTSDAAGVRSLTRLQGQSWSDSTLSQCGGGRWPRLLRAPAESPRLCLLPGWERLAWSSPGKHTHSPGKHTQSPGKHTFFRDPEIFSSLFTTVVTGKHRRNTQPFPICGHLSLRLLAIIEDKAISGKPPCSSGTHTHPAYCMCVQPLSFIRLFLSLPVEIQTLCLPQSVCSDKNRQDNDQLSGRMVGNRTEVQGCV